MRHVRNARQQFAELFVERFHLLVERSDPSLGGTHLFLAAGGIGAFAAQPADLRAFDVGAGLQPLGLGDGRPAPPVDLAKLVQAGNAAARRETARDILEIVPEMGEIVQSPPC
jgi:hypothetical protein